MKKDKPEYFNMYVSAEAVFILQLNIPSALFIFFFFILCFIKTSIDTFSVS